MLGARMLAAANEVGQPADPVLALFANGELGAYFDTGDISTLFQDTGKTTPVTADGQSVHAIADNSGNGNDATNSATVPVYAAATTALDYSGSTQAYLAAPQMLFTNAISVFARVNAPSNSSYQHLVSRHTGKPDASGTLRLTPGGVVEVLINTAGTFHSIDGATDITGGSHAAGFVYDGSAVTIYVGGAQDSQAAISGAMPSSVAWANTLLGINMDSGGGLAYPLAGIMGRAFVINRAITASEIASVSAYM